MATSWNRIASSICDAGLAHCGVKQTGQSTGADDMAAAMDALDAVLKELPLWGYSWPKLTSEAPLVWVGNQTITLPSDYYGYLRVWSDGRPLTSIPHSDWIALDDRRTTAAKCTHFYVSPANVLYLYPNPDSEPLLTAQYQRIVSDVTAGAVVDMPQFWVNTLGYGVANELLVQFEVPEPRATRIEKRWYEKRTRALGNSVSNDIIIFGVADARAPDPTNWQTSGDDGTFDGGSA